ncbi:MAG: tRNA pseudouridine(13) synthase TruD [Planctomycetaceae bacterium]
MKLRCVPEDFHVDELAQPETGRGEFALYRLTKRSLGTPEAVTAIGRQWKLMREHVAFGGLKDRHAVTEQYLTVWRGPRKNLTQENIRLVYLGQTPRSFESASIDANRFQVVLRDMTTDEADKAKNAFAAAMLDGLPNYFDDQRFGSVGLSGDFVARPWCSGDFERTLWLAIAEENVHDRPRDKDEKSLLRQHWGNWDACVPGIKDEVRRAVVQHLAGRPTDFRTAVTRIPAESRRMFLSAFQSHLWNRILAETLRASCPPSTLIESEIGTATVVFFRDVEPALRTALSEMELPLPTAREKLEEGPQKELYERIAAEYGLEVRTLRVKYPRDSFFSRGSRSAIYQPMNHAAEAAPDELHRERQKLILKFDLPRGSYATILVKRLMLEVEPSPPQEE